MNPDPFSLYIHFPYCLRKCSYCDFVSYPLEEPRGVIAEYICALEKEMALLSMTPGISGRDAGTIFFGGGTPSLMTSEEIERIIGTIKRLFGVDAGAEITVEANPGSVAEAGQWMSGVRAAGVNRISVGVQSLDDDELELLGRPNEAAAAESFVCEAAGVFDSVSVDLIYGLPGQAPSRWLETLERALSHGPHHVSIYCLEIPPGTLLRRRVRSGEIPEPDPDIQAEMYYSAVNCLESAGRTRYEISNFALDGHCCRHNLAYWTGGDYAGAGPAASSYISGARYTNAADIETYIKKLDRGLLPRAHGERLSSRRALRELAVMALRTMAGAAPREFEGKFSQEEIARLETDLRAQAAQGHLRAGPGNRYCLAAGHTFTSDSIFSALIL